MVNCKGIANSQQQFGNQQLCRYCRTQICEECYTQATNQSSMHLPESVRHQHTCMSCIRLHPKAKASRSPPRERRPTRLLRAITVPLSSGHCIGSLSNMARDRNEWGSQTPEEVELPTSDLPRRRHTSAIAPTSRSVDFAKPSSKLPRARELLRANMTERQTAQKPSDAMELQRRRREFPITYLCDFTQRCPWMVVCDATPTEPKQKKHSKMDRQDVPKSQSCDFTGTKLSDEQEELRLLTADLQLGKHKVRRPAPMKRGRRTAATDPANSAHAPVQRKSKRHDAPPKEIKKQTYRPETTKSVSSAGNCSFFKSKKSSDQRIDVHLSANGLRPQSRRHTTTEASTHNTKTSRRENLEPVVEEVDICEHDRYARFQQKRMTEPIDFHLSRFNLTSRRFMAEAESVSDNVKGGHHDIRRKEKTRKAIPARSEHSTSKYSTNELCDLAYLEKFRSHT